MAQLWWLTKIPYYMYIVEYLLQNPGFAPHWSALGPYCTKYFYYKCLVFTDLVVNIEDPKKYLLS